MFLVVYGVYCTLLCLRGGCMAAMHDYGGIPEPAHDQVQYVNLMSGKPQVLLNVMLYTTQASCSSLCLTPTGKLRTHMQR